MVAAVFNQSICNTAVILPSKTTADELYERTKTRPNLNYWETPKFADNAEL